MGKRISWFGKFSVARRVATDLMHEHNGFYLTGTLAGGPQVAEGRTVELFITRERLESMVVNLTADGRLFRGEANDSEPLSSEENMSATNRLRMLAQLGVQGDEAYRIARVPQPKSEVPPVRVLA